VEQETFISPVVEGKYEELLYNLAKMAQYAMLKYIYKRSYRYNEIIRYDREKDDWIALNLPSKEYFSKIGRYVNQGEIKEFMDYFLKYKNR